VEDVKGFSSALDASLNKIRDRDLEGVSNLDTLLIQRQQLQVIRREINLLKSKELQIEIAKWCAALAATAGAAGAANLFSPHPTLGVSAGFAVFLGGTLYFLSMVQRAMANKDWTSQLEPLDELLESLQTIISAVKSERRERVRIDIGGDDLRLIHRVEQSLDETDSDSTIEAVPQLKNRSA